MAGFQCWDDALGTAQVMERRQGFGVGDADVLGTANVFEEGVFRADAGVIQPGADAVGLGDLAVVILQHISAVAVQHARAAALQRGRVTT